MLVPPLLTISLIGMTVNHCLLGQGHGGDVANSSVAGGGGVEGGVGGSHLSLLMAEKFKKKNP